LRFCDDPKYQLDAADKLLGKLGFGGKAPAIVLNKTENTKTTNIAISPEDLQEARGRIQGAVDAEISN